MLYLYYYERMVCSWLIDQMRQNEVKGLLNENKVKMMTKMAIYEKNDGRRMLKTAKYFKGDFVALGVLKSLITTTFAYIIVVIMYVLCNLENIVADINSLDYTQIGKKMGIYYVIMLAVFALIAGLVSAYQYEHSRKGLKRYFSRLNKLERFYNGQKSKK